MLAAVHARAPLLLGRRLLSAVMRVSHPCSPYSNGLALSARLSSSFVPWVQPGRVSERRVPASTGAGAAASCCSLGRQRHVRSLAASAAAGAGRAPSAERQEPQQGPESIAAAVVSHAHAAAAADSRPPAELELDWKVGAALAGASFEAYCLLEERGIPERHACGAEVFYLDREFVHGKLAGLLHVAVRGAVSPPAAEARSVLSPGPQLRLAVGASTWASIAAVNNPSPDWEEQCTLYVRCPQQQVLRVQVWDPGSRADDCSLGCAVVELPPLCNGQTHEVELELFCSGDTGAEGGHRGPDAGGSGDAAAGQGDAAACSGSGSADSDSQQGEPCGSVRLRCRFFSFEEALAQGAAADSEMGPPVVGIPGQIPLAADWREVLELAGVAAHAMFEPVAYIENTTTDTEAWVYWNEQQAAACVAFRGTEQGKWRDILTDLHLVPAPLDPNRIAQAPTEAALAEVSQPAEEPGRLSRILATVEQAKAEVAAERAQQEEEQSSKEQAERHILVTAAGAVVSAAEDLKAILDRVRAEIDAVAEQEAGGMEPQPWVHSGFLTAYDSVRPAVLSVLATLLEGEAPRSWRLYLTGHSLGGALATLCAWDCAHRSWPTPVELEVWNFGCPRVGNRAFAEHYNRLVPSTWRVVNARDTVCTLPRLVGYAHVGHAIHLEPDGSVQLIMHSTQRLGEGVSLPDVAPAVSAAVTSTVTSKVPELIPDAATAALEKVPDLLPAAATTALEKLGLEVASAGSLEEDAHPAEALAAASISMALEDVTDIHAATGNNGGASDASDSSSSSSSSAATSAGGGGGGAPLALSPEHLGRLWEEERAAWALLLDGALDPHMETQYLAGLRALLEAQQAQHSRQPG